MGIPVAVALMVLLLAEVALRLGRSALGTPSAWPAPELQKKYDQMSARVSSHRSTDVVLVGDSMMDAGGDPSALRAASGLSAYNASVAGETLPTIAEWTTKVVVPRLHPKVVVIGFSSNELNPMVLSPALGLATYHRARAVRAAEGTGGAVDRADAFLRRWSMLYRYRSELRHPFSQAPGAAEGGESDPRLSPDGQDLFYAGRRYLDPVGVDQGGLRIGGVIAALKGFTVGPRNVAILRGMITTLRSQGIGVLLIPVPVTADLVSFHPAGGADYQLALASFASIAQASGATYAVPGVWPTSEFADPVHLNGPGTGHFSSFLAPLLREAVASASIAGRTS